MVLSGDVEKLKDLDLTVEVRPSAKIIDTHNYADENSRKEVTVMMNGGLGCLPDIGDGKEHCKPCGTRPHCPTAPVLLPYHIENNTLIAMWTADRQFAIGDYDIILYAHKNEGGQAVCDQYRFVRLVAHSAQADAPDDSGIEAVITMQPLTLSLSGLSAYEVAVVNGFQGSVEEWLESLKAGKLSSYVSVESIDNLPQQGDESTGYIIGTKLYIYVGTGGDTLEGKYKDVGEFRGPQGAPGSNGKSAYELAVEGGYEGSVEEWLLSLKGRDGVDGVNGADGLDGENGKDGVTPLIRWNNNRIEQSTDNGKSWWALSDKFNNKLYIKGYVTSADKLPKNALVGDMYGVGPIYGDDDVEQTKPYYQVYVNTVTDWAKSATITKVYQGDTELPQSAENNEIILIKKSTDNYLVYKYVNGSWNLLANLAEIYVEKDDIVNKGDNIFALVQSEIENQYELYERVVSWRNSGTFTSITAGIVNELGDSENAVMSQKAVTDELNNINANTGVDGYPMFSESEAYSAGDVVNYQGKLYRFTADHAAGTWTGSDAEDYSMKKNIDNSINEFNISVMYPTGGTDGTDRYTLETAIAKIPGSLRTVGIKCSFLNDAGELETWQWQGTTWFDYTKWTLVVADNGSALFTQLERFINLTGGITITAHQRKVTDYLPLDGVEVITIKGYSDDTLVSLYYFYDKDKNPISGLHGSQYSNRLIRIEAKNFPEGAAYFRATGNWTKNDVLTGFTISSAYAYINNIKEEADSGESMDFPISGKYVNFDGNIVGTTRQNAITEYLPLDGVKAIEIMGRSDNNFVSLYYFYDKDKNPISGLHGSQYNRKLVRIEAEDFPEGAAYFIGNGNNDGTDVLTGFTASSAYAYINSHSSLFMGPVRGVASMAASLMASPNTWLETACDILGCDCYNKAVSGQHSPYFANLVWRGTYCTDEEFENMDILAIQFANNGDIYTLPESKEDMTVEEYETALDPDEGNPFSIYSSAQCVDYLLKKWQKRCYEQRNVETSRWYDTKSGKPCRFVFVTHWHDGRTTYNEAIRKLRDRWGGCLCAFDEKIGFSKNRTLEGGIQPSTLYAKDTIMEDNITYGWHPLSGSSGKYIQTRMANIFANAVFECYSML